MLVNSVDISKYKNLVWTLVNRVNDPKLNLLIRTAAIGSTSEERNAILDATIRASENCLRTLDFRSFFAEQCRPFNYLGVHHYLDAQSADLFTSLLKKTNGRYTLGIYDEVNQLAKLRHAQKQKSSKQDDSTLKAKIVHLNRNNVSHLAARFKAGENQKTENKNNLERSLLTSIEQRIHEEHFLNQNNSIIYLANQTGLEYRLNCAFRNESTDGLWQFIQIGQEDCLAKRLLNTPDIQFRTEDDNGLFSCFFLVKKVIVEGKLEFVHIKLADAMDRIKLEEDFAEFLEQKDVKLIKIDLISKELNDDLHVPSLLNEGYSQRIEDINRQPTQETKALINSSNTLLFLTDETHLINELELLNLTRSPKRTFATLPSFLEDLIIENEKLEARAFEAVHKNTEKRLEDRFKCVTNCIVTDCDSDYTYVGKTIDISTRGLAIKFDQEVLFSDKVMVSLPAINRRMGIMVKNQMYSCVEAGSSILRVKVTGSVKDHQGRFLKKEFISKYFSQLKVNGKKEDLTGLSHLLRSVISAFHTNIPFTYNIDKRASFIETICINQFSNLRNIPRDQNETDLKELLSAKGFNNFIGYLLKKLNGETRETTGYLLVLPNVTNKAGKHYKYWLEDLHEVSSKQGNFSFIDKLNHVSAVSILAVRLCKPLDISDRYFADELQHLKRVSPDATRYIPTRSSDIVAYGEIKDITEIFLPEQQPEIQLDDDSILIEV